MLIELVGATIINHHSSIINSPQLRIDPLTARRIIVAENRAGRPNDFAGAELSPVEQNTSPHANCPFCPGNESQTPHEKYQLCDDSGHWKIRVVPNRFPAVQMDAPVDAAVGLHEVIVESPAHVSRANQVTAAHWADVLRVHAARIDHAATLDNLHYALLFKNVGASGGASLTHLHSQFLALPDVPAAMQSELAALRRYHEQYNRCGWCDRIAEARTSDRIVAERDGLIAFCPAAARQPYETWILPVSHAADFRSILQLESSPKSSATGSASALVEPITLLADPEAPRELSQAAEFIHDILCRVERAIGSVGYNVMVQTCPLGGVEPQHYHWRIEILPRVSPLAGLELATGIHICSLSPEHAAAELRGGTTQIRGSTP